MPARRRIGWAAAAAIALWVVTGLVGVPDVVRRLPALEARSIAADPGREERGAGTIARGVEVHVRRAFALFPFVVSSGNRLPTKRRAVLGYGFGACFVA